MVSSFDGLYQGRHRTLLKNFDPSKRVRERKTLPCMRRDQAHLLIMLLSLRRPACKGSCDDGWVDIKFMPKNHEKSHHLHSFDRAVTAKAHFETSVRYSSLCKDSLTDLCSKSLTLSKRFHDFAHHFTQAPIAFRRPPAQRHSKLLHGAPVCFL